jgi:hypothetical protein
MYRVIVAFDDIQLDTHTSLNCPERVIGTSQRTLPTQYTTSTAEIEHISPVDEQPRYHTLDTAAIICWPANYTKFLSLSHVSLIMSVWLFVRMEELDFHWKDFDKTWYLDFFFPKIFQENSIFTEIRQK